MELRLQFNQTIRIQVSDKCTLHNLKQTLLQTLCSSLPPDSVHLSLNGRDDLEQLSPENPLPSLGINSGDLLFFNFNRTVERSQSIDSDLEKLRLENLEPIGVVPENCPKSILLSRVMKEKLGHGRNAHKLLVIAVHAALLDSGLLLIDPLDMAEDWSSPFSVSIRYTFREPNTMKEVVLLKFNSTEHFVIVNESIDCSRGSSVYRVTLDRRTYAPNLDSIWANSMSPNKIIDEKEWNIIERKMCKLWKVVKDGLVLPMFMVLPHDIMLKIMESLSGVDIGKLQCVCTELYDLGNDKDLWRLKLNQEFPWVVDPQNESFKQKFEECHRNRMNMIAINMEQEPPQLDFVHYGVWQAYIAPYLQYHFDPSPWYNPFAHDPFHYALGAYRYWRGQDTIHQHLEWQGQGQGRGRGQNAYNPHHGVQGRGSGQNAFDPHHGLQGRGRGRARGRGRGW